MIVNTRINEPNFQSVVDLVMRLTCTILFFLMSLSIYAQHKYLVIENNENLCLDSMQQFKIKDSLPTNLKSYTAIFLFSNARSYLSRQDIDRIINYVKQGGGLYTGADNWPMQAESNQVTQRLFNKESFGHYENKRAEASQDGGNLQLKELEEIPAGQSTVAFPLDYRLKVEAWVEDQPLILSGKIGKGKIIIDGGYSRFYCDRWNQKSCAIMDEFFNYFN